MNAEHTRHLLESYPKLYVQHDRPPTETAMCFLFDCGDGWFDIIDLLSKQLEWLNDTGDLMHTFRDGDVWVWERLVMGGLIVRSGTAKTARDAMRAATVGAK